jgi:Lon protease-like protein
MSPPATSEIILFPLRMVLFPHARSELQIVEARYMDLVKSSLKADGGFGVLLQGGSEVDQRGRWRMPELVDIGCFGSIVDWDALPQGRLGVVLEGGDKFRLLESWKNEHHLLHGRVEWLHAEAQQALPQNFDQLPALLARLAEHPSIQKLNMQLQPNSALHTANQLAQLLPISLQEKQQLLALDQPLERLQLIDDLLAALES